MNIEGLRGNSLEGYNQYNQVTNLSVDNLKVNDTISIPNLPISTITSLSDTLDTINISFINISDNKQNVLVAGDYISIVGNVISVDVNASVGGGSGLNTLQGSDNISVFNGSINLSTTINVYKLNASIIDFSNNLPINKITNLQTTLDSKLNINDVLTTIEENSSKPIQSSAVYNRIVSLESDVVTNLTLTETYKNNACSYMDTTLSYRNSALSYRNSANTYATNASKYSLSSLTYKNETETLKQNACSFSDNCSVFANNCSVFADNCCSYLDQINDIVGTTTFLKGSNNISINICGEINLSSSISTINISSSFLRSSNVSIGNNLTAPNVNISSVYCDTLNTKGLNISASGAKLKLVDIVGNSPSIEFIQGYTTDFGGDVIADWKIGSDIDGYLSFSRTNTDFYNGEVLQLNRDGNIYARYGLNVSQTLNASTIRSHNQNSCNANISIANISILNIPSGALTINNISNLTETLNTKQGILTAGTNITISGGVISSTGGGNISYDTLNVSTLNASIINFSNSLPISKIDNLQTSLDNKLNTSDILTTIDENSSYPVQSSTIYDRIVSLESDVVTNLNLTETYKNNACSYKDTTLSYRNNALSYRNSANTYATNASKYSLSSLTFATNSSNYSISSMTYRDESLTYATNSSNYSISSMTYRDESLTYATNSSNYSISSKNYRDESLTYATNSSNYSISSKNYQDQSLTFATNSSNYSISSKNYRDQSLTYATNSSNYSISSKNYRDQSLTYATNSSNYSISSKNYRDQSLTYSTNSSIYSLSSLTYSNNAMSYRNSANTHQLNACSYMDTAYSYMRNSCSFADDAKGQAILAGVEAGLAGGSALGAGASALSAGNSATLAGGSATSAENSANNASTYRGQTLGYRNEASNYAGDANEYSIDARDYASNSSRYMHNTCSFMVNTCGYMDLAEDYKDDALLSRQQANTYKLNCCTYKDEISVFNANCCSYNDNCYIYASDAFNFKNNACYYADQAKIDADASRFLTGSDNITIDPADGEINLSTKISVTNISSTNISALTEMSAPFGKFTTIYNSTINTSYFNMSCANATLKIIDLDNNVPCIQLIHGNNPIYGADSTTDWKFQTNINGNLLIERANTTNNGVILNFSPNGDILANHNLSVNNAVTSNLVNANIVTAEESNFSTINTCSLNATTQLEFAIDTFPVMTLTTTPKQIEDDYGDIDTIECANLDLPYGDITAQKITLVTANIVDLQIPNESLTITKIDGLQTALDSKQGTLTAGTNITINGNTISATATPLTGTNNISVFNGSVRLNTTINISTINSSTANISTLTIPNNSLTIAKTNGLQTALDSKQGTLTAGSNISINGNTISATATPLTGTSNISVFNGSVRLNTTINISTINSSTANISTLTIPNNSLTIAKTTGLQTALDSKQGTLTAGTNISINGNTISATATPLTGTSNISVFNGSVRLNTTINISTINSSTANISTLTIPNNSLTIAKTTGLQTALDSKQGTLTAGTNISINGNTISATATPLTGTSNISVFNSSINLSTTITVANINSTGDIASTGRIIITGQSPTLYLREQAGSTERSGMIHMNANLMYFLSGVNNSTSWSQTANSRWPLYLNTLTNEAVFGGNISCPTTITTSSMNSSNANISVITLPDNALVISKISGLQTALNGKQATLTAGTNITINGNTISATGGGGGLVAGTNLTITNSCIDIKSAITLTGTITAGAFTTAGLIQGGNGLVGKYCAAITSYGNSILPEFLDYAQFSHKNLSVGLDNYALLQKNDGTTYLNAADTKRIYFKIKNSEVGSINNTGLTMTGTITSNGLTIQKSTGNSTLSIIDATTTRNPRIELIRGSSTFGADTYTDWRIHNQDGNLKFYRQDTTNNGESMYLPYNGGLVVNSGTITAQGGLIAKNAYLTNFGTGDAMILKNTTMADTSYLVAQGSDGTSNINCHSGKKIIIRVGDAEKGSIDTNGLTMSGTIAGGTLNGTTINVADKLIITNTSPTLYLRDTDHRSGMVHMNANRMYFLSGPTNSTTWQEVNGRWPLYLQTDTNAAYFGGHIETPSTITAGGTITTPTLNATNIGGSTTYGSDWARGGKSIIKNYNADANWAQFSHYNFAYSNTQYALLQHSNGTTLVNCAAGTQLEFRRENAYRLKLDSDGSGTFAGWSRATSHKNYSDDRLKHNEIDISGLEIIRQLNPKKYDKTFEPIYDVAGNPITDYHGEIEKEHFQEAGFVAQEVLKTDLSWVVSEPSKCSEEGTFEPYSVDYNCIMTYGIQAIKELDIIVQRLEKRIGDLEAENDLLTSRVEELENNI